MMYKVNTTRLSLKKRGEWTSGAEDKMERVLDETELEKKRVVAIRCWRHIWFGDKSTSLGRRRYSIGTGKPRVKLERKLKGSSWKERKDWRSSAEALLILVITFRLETELERLTYKFSNPRHQISQKKLLGQQKHLTNLSYIWSIRTYSCMQWEYVCKRMYVHVRTYFIYKIRMHAWYNGRVIGGRVCWSCGGQKGKNLHNGCESELHTLRLFYW